jgi:hypothetical protein
MRAAVIDLDHNGMLSTVTRLIELGVSQAVLSDLDRFRYAEPEDKTELIAVVRDLAKWKPDVVVIDSIGELLPAMGLNSNSPDDFTIAHTHVLKPLARAGCCVIVIDHVAKNPDSKAQGPTGTVAKSRAIGGVSLRVKVDRPFTPGQGGSAFLSIRKDRHGGLRAKSPTGDKEPLAGTFRLLPDGSNNKWSVRSPEAGERLPDTVPGEDLEALLVMDPPPTSARDVASRLKWGNNRATIALRVYRQQLDNRQAA